VGPGRGDPGGRAAVRGWLDARADQRFWRLVARVARPTWRLVGRPAAAVADAAARGAVDVGLELATLLALLAVGAFTFFLLGHVILEDPFPRIDRWAFDIADPLHMAMLVDVAKVVTDLGAFPTVAAAALATAVWAVARGRRAEAAALVVGLLLSHFASNTAKAAYDRPRPSGALVDTMQSAYPSGHSLQAVTLVACATVLVRGGAGWAARIALVAVAAGLVAVVAATRVYLRAHYVTDVLGGVALGAAVWSLVGIAAMLAGRRSSVGAR
jgi:membrane-associated phospholipid phosphatase